MPDTERTEDGVGPEGGPNMQEQRTKPVEIQKRELRLQTIQTVVIVCGLLFALFELSNIWSEKRMARYHATSDMLAQFAAPEMIDGANALLEAGELEPSRDNYNTTLARLTPLRQHYIVWSACLAEGVCLSGASRDLFCKRLIAYEYAVEEVMIHFGRNFDWLARESHYFGELGKCIDDHEDWVETTFP